MTSLANAIAGIFGEFSGGISHAHIARTLVDLGAVIAPCDTASLTHIVRGDVTRRLSEAIGALPAERALALRTGLTWIEESDLDALARSTLGRSLDSTTLAPSDSTSGPPSLEHALSAPDSAGIVVLRDALLAPGAVDPALRHRLANALAASDEPLALAALATVLDQTRGSPGTHEAHAFGQLAARGTTRFSHAAPIAIEFPERRATSRDALVTLAMQAGAYETLTDEQGRAWHRVRFARVPAIPTRATSDATFFALLRGAARRRDARVWIAGCALRADLAWSSWIALLAPLSAPHVG